MSTAVFISGATGFIAQHIINLLIQRGYQVVGSVRSTAKGEYLKKNFGSKFSYEVVEHLEDEGAFEKSLLKHPEVTVFLHTASPVIFETENPEKKVIIPAVNGTKNVLKAIKSTAPQIKKVVLTSSIVSQLDFRDKTEVADESSWNVTLEEALLDPQTTYSASKKFAEQAAWDFVKSENPDFTLTTIHPVLVLGPQVFDEDAKGDLNLSNGFISGLLKLKEGDEVPPFEGESVDVADVAEAHIIAFERDDSANRRLILTNERFNNQSILDIIHQHIPELSEKVIKGNPGGVPLGLKQVNSTKSREYLGLQYTSLKDSVIATLKQYTRVNGL